MDGSDWADIIQAGTGSFLQVYSTVTQKPIAQQRPNSMMEAVVGADYASGRSAGIGGSAVLVLVAVIVGAVFIFKD